MTINHILPIEKQCRYTPALDSRLRAALGSDIAGINTYNGNVQVIFLSMTGDATATDIVNAHDTLTVDATKTTIDADESDSTTITVSGLSSFDYAVYRNDRLVASGSAPDGSMVLSTDQVGTYMVEIIDGNNTGYVEVIAI